MNVDNNYTPYIDIIVGSSFSYIITKTLDNVLLLNKYKFGSPVLDNIILKINPKQSIILTFSFNNDAPVITIPLLFYIDNNNNLLCINLSIDIDNQKGGTLIDKASDNIISGFSNTGFIIVFYTQTKKNLTIMKYCFYNYIP